MTFLFAFLLFLIQGARAQVEVCGGKFCGGIEIKFPFGLKGANQEGRRCTYPKFEVWCDEQKRTILRLPNSGNLVVESINYEAQTIQVNDPNQCLPKRFLHNLSLSGTPFDFDPSVYSLLNLTFLRCQSNITYISPISCLGDPTNSSSVVIYTWSRPVIGLLSQWCDVVSSVFFPISRASMWPFWPDLTQDIQLTWTDPDCGDCEAQEQDCGFARDRGLQVGCFSRPQKESPGLPRSAKYGLTIGVGIPGLLCLIGVSCFMCGKVRMYSQRRNPRPSIELPVSVVVQTGPFMMGLDGPTIEKYPKTLLGESGRLPKPNDNTCSICLSEYEPKETLRTIPDCNHYFHAHCIDEWLKMNATCPVCRNSPPFTPSTFSSLSPSSSLSSTP